MRGIDYRNTDGKLERAEVGAVIDNLTNAGVASLVGLKPAAIRKTTKAVTNG